MNSTGFKTLLKLGGGALGLLAAFAIAVAVNIIAGGLHARKDLTEEKIFTLSEGTRSIIARLDSPVTLKYFYSRSSAEAPVPLKTFARQVQDLLQEYRIAGGQSIAVETYDPTPDSEAEEWAERYGLSGQHLGALGDGLFYCGLVAVKGDAIEAIPFLDPRSEEMLEYNITRMIARVANPKKPVLGIMSALPVMGVRSFPYAMPGQPAPRNQPPWATFQDLGRDYDVRQLPPAADKIDSDISVVILVHPKNLSDATLFALDQFLLRGGRIMAFVDPLCIYEAMNPDPAAAGRPGSFSEITKLTQAWGIAYEPSEVVADLEAATRVRRNDNAVDESPVFLSLRRENIDGSDTLTAPLESMILPGAGAFSVSATDGLAVSVLLASSPQSQPVNSMIAQMGSEAIRRDFKPGLKKLNLALRLRGNFKTAFPDGAPTAAAGADGKDKETETGKEPALKESAKPSAVILVADVDMLYDAFTVQDLAILGIKGYQPINDNLNFFINAVDQLAGSIDLASIRSRGRFDRPFDRVIALQRAAQEKWLLQERALQQQLESTRERLESLQNKKDKNQKFILSPEQQQEIERFRQEQAKTQRELKQVRKNLREGIERLGVKVKVANILIVPLLVAASGIAFAWHRRLKTKSVE